MRKITTLCLLLLMAMATMADDWTLVTDASSLSAGDQIVLAYADKEATASLSTKSTSSAAYLEPATSTFSGTTISSLGANTAIFTLSGTATAWTLTSQEDKALGVTAVKKVAWASGTTTWTITITDGKATIASTDKDRGQILYNTSSPRFTTYASPSTQTKNVQIYRNGSLAPVPQQHTLTYQGFPYKKTSCDDPTFAAGTIQILSTATPTKDGKTLTGWRYDGKTYEPGAAFTMPDEDVILAPVWDNETDIENVPAGNRQTATKVLRNGQLYIIFDGYMYNVQGKRIQL